ncbi:MAG TPA: ABC transporter permease [Candidatus Babeliaceae bacterium]|nr:ABC transporter permease [Candidatus Babeliaceae bacterium]
MKQSFIDNIKQEFPFFIGIPGFIWQLLFFYIPLLFVLALSVADVQDGIVKGFTLSNFTQFFSLVFARVIIRSCLLGIFTAITCLLFAYPIAYFMAFKAKRFKNLLLFLLIVPFWTNFLLHIYAWFFVLERQGFLNNLLINIGLIQEPLIILNSMVAVGIMMVYYYLPFMVLPIYSVLEKFDKRLLEASADLGATWLSTFRRILLPLTMPGIQAGFFLVFVPSFAEFAIPELMGGDKKMFVGTVVSHYILGGQTISSGAAFTVLSSLVLITISIVLYALMRRLMRVSS